MNGAIEGRGGRRGMHACMQHISIYYTGICMRGHKGAISIRAYRYSSRTKTLLNPYPTASMLHSLVTLTTRYPVRDEDMEVNPAKEKKLTNIRTVQADEKVMIMRGGAGRGSLPFRDGRYFKGMEDMRGLLPAPATIQARACSAVCFSHQTAPTQQSASPPLSGLPLSSTASELGGGHRVRGGRRAARGHASGSAHPQGGERHMGAHGGLHGGAHMQKGTWTHGGARGGMQRHGGMWRVHERTRKGGHYSNSPSPVYAGARRGTAQSSCQEGRQQALAESF